MAKQKQLHQDILLRVRAPMLPANNGLKQSIDLLQKMDMLMRGINQHYGSAASRMGAFTAKGLTELLKVKHAKTLDPHDLGKILGMTPASIDRWVATFRSDFAKRTKSMFRGGEFTSLPKAGEFFNWAFKKEQVAFGNMWKQIGARPSLSDMKAMAAAGGKLSANQVHATLVTPPLITLHVPSSAIQAVLTGGPIQVAGQAGGQAAGASSGSGSKSATPSVPRSGGETRRVTRKDADGNIKSVTVEEALAPFHTKATTFAGDKETSVETERAAAALRNKVNSALRQVMTDHKAGGGSAKGDPLRRARAFESTASELDRILQSHGADLSASGLGHIASELQSRAAGLRTEAQGFTDASPTRSGRKAMGKHLAGARKRRATEAANLAAAEAERVANLHAEQRAIFDERIRQTELRNELEEARQRGLRDWRSEQNRRDSLRAKQQRVLDKARREATPPRIDHGTPVDGAPVAPVPSWRKKWFGPTGVASLGNLGNQMFSNAASVTAWGLPSFGMTAAMAGTMAVGRHTGQAAVETSMQTARLSQVFKGVGGDAKQLTQDVLTLAAAEGRSRKEAMESAIQWARLGLTRREVAEATRVSLLAANVAEIDSLEATEKLQAVQKAYGLQIRELAGVLGMLNSISNTYNVTNSAMLEGLTRTASIARQAGVPLAELVGLMGATVGATGQSGANIGNAMKSILVSLSNPEIQEFLGDRYGLNAKSGGKMKSGSQRLQELYMLYQGLDPAERQNVLYRVAGKTQASRMSAMMDSYVAGQVLGVRSQRNLGSAEDENAKIKAELASKWTGLVTQFDGLVNAVNRASGATDLLATTLGAASFAMRTATRYQNFGSQLMRQSGLSSFGSRDPLVLLLRVLNHLESQTPEGKQHAFDRRLEQQRAGVASSRQMQQLYATVSGVNLSDTDADWVSSMMNPAAKRAFLDARAKGDKSGMRQALAQASAVESVREDHVKREQQVAMAAELARIEADLRPARSSGDRKTVAELEARRNALTRLGSTFDDESLSHEAVEGVSQAKANAHASIRYRMQGASGLRGGSATASGQLFDELNALRRQERMLLDEQTRIPAGDYDRQKDVGGMLRDVRSSIHARVAGAGFAGEQDRNMLARELVKSELDVSSVGRDQIEILSHRSRKYAELVDLNRQMFAGAQSQQDMDKAMSVSTALRAEREQLILDRVRARAGAAKEEYEANRRLLTMGPQQLLTQLVGQRLAARGVGAGQFMALSPDTREAVLEQGDRNRRKRFLNETPDFDNLLGQLQGGSLNRLLELANYAATHVGTLGGKAAETAKNLADLNAQIAAAKAGMGGPAVNPGGGPPAVPQAPQAGVQRMLPFPKAQFWTDHFDGTFARQVREWQQQ